MTAVTRPTFAFRPSISFALAAVMLILLCTSAAAQDTTGVGAIGGVVVNAAGQPAEGVRVCALDTSSCATSDARGVFQHRRAARRKRIGWRFCPSKACPSPANQVDVRAGLDGTVEITLPTVGGLPADGDRDRAGSSRRPRR